MRTLADWLTLQESVHPQTIDMGLARVAQVARTLGVDTAHSAVITVGGTNGKGSIAAQLEALLAARGAVVGLFTSPHLLRYNERIRIEGREADDAALIEAFERIEAARADTTLTFFEYNTLAALLLFAARAVDVAVLEVGLGGRLDAVNLLDADVAVLASVGFDHRDWLGDTLELIGAEKAGILRPQRPAVLGTADMPASVYAAIGACGAQAVVAGTGLSLAASGKTAGTTPACHSSSAHCRLPHSRAPSSTATPRPHWPRSRRCRAVPGPARAQRARLSASRRRMRHVPRRHCAACNCRGASRWCRGRWSGSWTSPTTRRLRGCWRGSWRRARCRAPAGTHHRRHRCTQRQGRRGDRQRTERRHRPLDRLRAARCTRRQRRRTRRAPGLAAHEPRARRRPCQPAASGRAPRPAPASAWSCAVLCTPWDRRSSGFGYNGGGRRGRLRGVPRAASAVLALRGLAPIVGGLVKERLTGAIILVALIVLLVPEFLRGPVKSAPRTVAASAEEPPLRSYTINLGDDAHARDAAAQPQSATPQPLPSAAAATPAAAVGAGRYAHARRGTPDPDTGAGRAAQTEHGAIGRRRTASRGCRAERCLDGADGELRQPRQRRAPGASAEGAGIQRERFAGHGRPSPLPGAGGSGARSRRRQGAAGETQGRRPRRLGGAEIAAGASVTRALGNPQRLLYNPRRADRPAATIVCNDTSGLSDYRRHPDLGGHRHDARVPARGRGARRLDHRAVPRLALLRPHRAAPGRPHGGLGSAAVGGARHHRGAGAGAGCLHRRTSQSLRAPVHLQRRGPSARLRLRSAARFPAAGRVRDPRAAAAAAGGRLVAPVADDSLRGVDRERPAHTGRRAARGARARELRT